MLVIKNKPFSVFLSSKEINLAVEKVANQMNTDFAGQSPLFLIVLNGAFMFASDLMKKITIGCELSFVKVSSYEGMSSTTNLKQLIGLVEDVKGRTIVIIEDIIDTGVTMEGILNYLKPMGPRDIKIATLLYKPEAFTKTYKIDYVGTEVPNKFLVGYGLDYDGEGRNLQDIYILDSK
jgi:hypoxanthine phosphoribosyltransferase